ncbi:MAG: terminase small subunit [Desulfurellales bacterium]|nr:MAG: terminase small subunit [Desulfurellales bacterium]
MRPPAVTERHKLFIEAYIATRNATESAKAAGYSPKSAHAQGNRLLKDAEIQKAVAIRVEKAIITADEVLNGIKQIALTAERDADRLKAYELLGKHLAMWTTNINVIDNDIIRQQAQVIRTLAAKAGKTPADLFRETLETAQRSGVAIKPEIQSGVLKALLDGADSKAVN